jgi:hypothetical protein
VHLLLAGLVWSTVGAWLVILGARWSWRHEPALTPWLLPVAVALGLVKSRLVMDRAGRGIVQRIRERGDGRCLGGFVSPLTWLLIAVMMGMGRLLRSHNLAPQVVSVVYVAVGTALVVSSRLMWGAWRDRRHRPPAS